MDFTKTCWYCGRADMKPYDSFYACESCGATWNAVPKLGFKIVEDRRDLAIGGYSRSPSDALVEEVQKARAAAGLDAVLPAKRKGIGKKTKKRKVKDASNILERSVKG